MYQSPFRIVNADELPHEPDALRRALALAKKKLLAEFELAGSPSIILGSRELHRQDIFSLFEELADESRLSRHLAIWRDSALLGFLEEGRISPGQTWMEEPLYDDHAFLAFISPHFADACNAFMQCALGGAASAEELQALGQAKCLLLPKDSEAAYRYATRFYTEKKNELLSIRHRADSGEEVGITEITGWCSDDQVHLLNCLPDTFASLRYTLANTLNNLCVAYDRKKASRHALAAIERAAAIHVEDEELSQLIPANLRIIRSKQSRTWYNTDPASGRKTPSIGLVILAMIIVIRILTAGDGCGKGSAESTAEHRLPTNEERRVQEEHGKALMEALAAPAATDSTGFELSRPALTIGRASDTSRPLKAADSSIQLLPGL